MGATIAWGRSLRALRSRNYRLFFAGQSVSLIGTWMTRLAMSWIVYQLTDSAFLLGLTSFVGQIPAFFVAPIAGVWLDRWNRHRVLVITQVLAMTQSLALAALAFTALHQSVVGDRTGAHAGIDQRLRYARPAGVRDRDDRRARRPRQCHRPELLDGERSEAGRPGHRGGAGRDRRGRRVFPDRRASATSR